MTSIDRAFQKAYAKRVHSIPVPPEQTDAVDREESAVWVDESSEKFARFESAQGVPTPHLNRNGHGDLQPATTAGDRPKSTSLTEEAMPPVESRVEGATTAYDAWSEKLETLETPVPPKRPPIVTPPSFSPVWEVDRFAIPERATQILVEYLEPIGSQLQRASREGLQTLAISSQARATGRTTMAIAIACAAAQAGLRVALVDGDVENPTLKDQLQLEVASDWYDVANQKISIDEATIQSISDGFCLLPLIQRRQEELSGVERYAVGMLEDLRHHFDLIIVDMSPLSQRTFGLSVPLDADFVDAVILVEDMQQTSADQLLAVSSRIRAVGIENIGLIENFVKEPATANQKTA